MRPAGRRRFGELHAQQRQTRIAIGEEASGGRVASPGKAARSEPLWVSGTEAAQRPSAPQTVLATPAKVAPAIANWISSGAPAGEEAVREAQLARQLHRRVRTRRVAARTVIPPAGRRSARHVPAGRPAGRRASVAGAGRRVAVAVAADALEGHRRAGRVVVGDPPREVTTTWPWVRRACSGSFQLIRRASASMPASGYGTEVNVPIVAIPVETEL